MKHVLSFGDEIRSLEEKTGGKLTGKQIYLLSKIRQAENTLENLQDRLDAKQKAENKEHVSV